MQRTFSFDARLTPPSASASVRSASSLPHRARIMRNLRKTESPGIYIELDSLDTAPFIE
jgi:hypothetical protein